MLKIKLMMSIILKFGQKVQSAPKNSWFLGVLCGLVWSSCPTSMPSAIASEFKVESLVLGQSINRSSNFYRSLKCTPSSLFINSFWCSKSIPIRNRRLGRYSKNYSLVHNEYGEITYINLEYRPAYFNSQDIDTALFNRERALGTPAKKLRFNNNLPGSSNEISIVHIWGDLRLAPLTSNEKFLLANKQSPKAGILFHTSSKSLRFAASNNLPVFKVQGTRGYVWQATYNSEGKGTLRFFAVNVSMMPMINNVTPNSNYLNNNNPSRNLQSDLSELKKEVDMLKEKHLQEIERLKEEKNKIESDLMRKKIEAEQKEKRLKEEKERIALAQEKKNEEIKAKAKKMKENFDLARLKSMGEFYTNLESICNKQKYATFRLLEASTISQKRVIKDKLTSECKCLILHDAYLNVKKDDVRLSLLRQAYIEYDGQTEKKKIISSSLQFCKMNSLL